MIEYQIGHPRFAEQYCALVERMVEGTKFGKPVLSKIANVLSREDYFRIGAWEGDILVGFLNGYTAPQFFTDAVWAYDLGLYVAPEYRGTTVAIKMIRMFEDWAKRRGASKLWLGQTVNNKPERTLRFFERLGYECQGFNTCKEL